ncbi:MAG: insulinase family protein [Oscillospiraceae bacterium]|nr:insulinase family protein [Oscillospiraceae bacterium]
MLNQGDTLHGFTVTRVRESAELGGRIVEMTYDKTGTELVWIDNGTENKLFSIAFKTLPENSTGVFHILEHSVLCGSKKYPVREPFVELLKSSMNTFLNAMTFPDKTMYPVSSRNQRDFLNLTEVYLDAVFAPDILRNPNIFCQEGWHIEQNADGTLSYKGVVFNEMKGALSSADDLAAQKLMEMLFPDTAYGFNSGGDPAVIPTLTYEQFKETYHRFYHPSNARIYLDGAIPAEETFSLLEEYLSQFERSDALPVLQMQKPVSAVETLYYDLPADESPENRSNLTIGRIVGDWQDRTKMLAVSVMLDAFAVSNETPLKRAVLSAGLAQEMDVFVETSIAQAYLQIHLKNVTDGRADEILPLLRKTAAELASKGLDKAALEASANRIEFRLMEPAEPQALERCVNSMNSWLYGGDPLMYLVYEEAFAEIRRMIADGAFDDLMREIFVDETGTAVLYSLPSHTRGEELRQEEAGRLAAIRSQWTEADFAENTAMNERLAAWQQTPDSPEQLATLPVLPLSEVSDQPSWTETVLQEADSVKLLYHPAPCRGIVHITLAFALTDFTLDELTLLSHAGSLFGKLKTEHHSALELQRELKSKLGRLETAVELGARKKQTETCTPMLTMRCSVLRDKLPEAFRLIREVLLTTDFGEKEKIREIVTQTNEQFRQMGIMAGHALGMTCVMARYSARNAVRAATGGYPVVKATQELVEQFDAQFDAFSGLMKRMQASLGRKRMAFASVTAQEPADITPLLASLPEGGNVPAEMHYEADMPEKSGYQIPAQIGFAVQGWQTVRKGIAYDAGRRVAAKIISLSYLWNQVRVQGGAYGTGLTVLPDTGIVTFSYRDPSPARSLTVNGGISEFIRQFCESGEPIDKFIISTVSDEEPLRAPREEGILADALWFAGKTREELVQERRQMLSVTQESLLADCAVWDAFAENGAVCVVASGNLLADCENLTILE